MGAGVASSTIGPIPSASDMHTSFYNFWNQTDRRSLGGPIFFLFLGIDATNPPRPWIILVPKIAWDTVWMDLGHTYIYGEVQWELA
jgi:hypothetical protein